MMGECAGAIGGAEIVIFGRAEDRDVLEKAAEVASGRFGVKITVDPKPISCSGGVRAMSPDGSVLYDNTFEARLDRLRPILRREVASLFGLGRGE